MVLGIDWDVVRQAVGRELTDDKDGAGAQRLAESYLQKIVQLPLDVSRWAGASLVSLSILNRLDCHAAPNPG